jgi:hypothetical protein
MVKAAFKSAFDGVQHSLTKIITILQPDAEIAGEKEIERGYKAGEKNLPFSMNLIGYPGGMLPESFVDFKGFFVANGVRQTSFDHSRFRIFA